MTATGAKPRRLCLASWFGNRGLHDLSAPSALCCHFPELRTPLPLHIGTNSSPCSNSRRHGHMIAATGELRPHCEEPQATFRLRGELIRQVSGPGWGWEASPGCQASPAPPQPEIGGGAPLALPLADSSSALISRLCVLSHCCVSRGHCLHWHRREANPSHTGHVPLPARP